MTRQIPLERTRQVVIDDDEIDLRQYLYVINKYKWQTLGIAIVLAVLATMVVFSMEPVYRSTATLLIESQEQKVVSIEEVYGLPNANDEYFETQNQILQSRDLAERVINKLDLVKHPEFDPTVKRSGFSLNPMSWIPDDWLQVDATKSIGDPKNQIVDKFSGRLSVTPVRNSQLITISFEAHDPELTAKVPNALAEAYIESNLEGRLAMTENAAGWITGRLDGLRKKVEESEQTLQAYRDREQLVDVKGVDSLAAKELDEITANLVDARRNLSETEALYRQVNAMRGQPISAFASIPSVLEDQNVSQANQKYAEAERKVSELAKRYGPKHPKMIASMSELETARNNLHQQIRNVIGSVEKRHQVARAKERELNRALKTSKGEMAKINRKEHTLRSLEREMETNRNLYEMFLTRFKETNVAGDLQPQNARLVDKAVVPSVPFKPNKRMVVMITFMLSLVGAMMLAFLIEALDNTLKDTADVENKLHLPVLGILPKQSVWADRKTNALRFYSRRYESGFAENIRTIRTSILLTGLDQKKKSILVTSSVPNEGKSVVAVNLALALAQMGGKVILIDADLRRPSVAKVFELSRKVSGLSQFISGSMPLETCIHHFKEDDLYVMPAGVIPPNPLELLSSDSFRQGIEKLKLSFDHLVIDSAPAVAVSDALVISKYVNSLIYVVKADDTPFQIAQEGIKRLKQVEAPLAGVVLNQVAPSTRPGRYGYYRGDYYKYYGYDKA